MAPVLAMMLVANALPVTPILAPSDSSGLAVPTARIVRAALEYTRWRGIQPDPVRLCVAGPARNAASLEAMELSGGRRIRRFNVPAASPALAVDCDALYLGAMPSFAARQTIARVRGAPVVTFAEADPYCRSEAMFCLSQEPGSVSFQLNIDAISRSAVTIDPRVLRMARGF